MVRQAGFVKALVAACSTALLTPSSVDAFSSTTLPMARLISNEQTIISSRRSPSTTSLLAQKMTPTRKTRRDDSFDRSSGDDENEEEGELVVIAYEGYRNT